MFKFKLTEICVIPSVTGSETVIERFSSFTMQTVGMNQTDDLSSLFDVCEDKSQGAERVFLAISDHMASKTIDP